MRGIVPSSAAAGSSAAGTPGTPTRTSRRVLGGPGALGGWAGADAGHARTSVNRMTGRRTSRTRIDILRYVYTWNPGRLPAVPTGRGTGRAERNLLPKAGHWRNEHADRARSGPCRKKSSKFTSSNDDKEAAH